MFYSLLAENELMEGLLAPKIAGGRKLLLIHHQSQTYVMENKCGHFGMPLHTGYIEDDTIVCKHHRISFYLKNGEVANHPNDCCDAIKSFKVVMKEGFIGVELSEDT